MIEQTIQVGNLQLRGRIVMPPMATEQADGGLVTPSMGAYYAARAKNPEIGLIITEHSYIEMRGKASRGQVSIAEDEAIEGLSTITKAIHAAAEGIKVFAQINHAGGYTSRDITGTEPVSASAGILKQEPARALTKDEILQIEELFAQAARRAQLAGYDGVEIHSAHSYLLNQFYSPLTNRRTDEYGCQTMENRLRMHLETIQKVREKVGENFPIAVRLGGCDYTPGGSTIEDSVEASLMLQKAGVDLLDLSGGMAAKGRGRSFGPFRRHVPVYSGGGFGAGLVWADDAADQTAGKCACAADGRDQNTGRGGDAFGARRCRFDRYRPGAFKRTVVKITGAA